RDAERGEQQPDDGRRRAEPAAEIGKHRNGDAVRHDVGEAGEGDERDGSCAGGSKGHSHETTKARKRKFSSFRAFVFSWRGSGAPPQIQTYERRNPTPPRP